MSFRGNPRVTVVCACLCDITNLLGNEQCGVTSISLTGVNLFGRCNLQLMAGAVSQLSQLHQLTVSPSCTLYNKGAKHDHHGVEKRGVSSQRPQSPGFRPVHLAPEVSEPSRMKESSILCHGIC